MSPEQAMERVLDARSDLFSLGTLLFHLVTGQLPFTGSNPSLILRNIIEGNRPSVLELAPDISGELADLIERLMQTDPGDRIQSAAEVVTQLQQCILELEIDPLHPHWSLQAWLLDPEAYGERLNTHLASRLLHLGKERLASRDHLGALRLFNRLLCIDDENEEVLHLVQSMHGARRAGPRPARHMLAGAGLLLACMGLAWLLWPEPLIDLDATARNGDGGADPRALTADPPEEVDAPPVVVATGAELTRPSPPAQAAEQGSDKDKRQRDDRAARKEAAPAPPSAEPASVLVTVPGSWGDIYIDGKLHGRTGSAGRITVMPGTHTLVIKNDHALPYRREFSVTPGESRTIEVTSLQRKPARYRLTGAVDGDCAVVVDGVQRGTMAGLSRTIRIQSPEKTHQLQVQCPDGTEFTRTLRPVGPGALVSVRLDGP
jgi:hypothetical protein